MPEVGRLVLRDSLGCLRICLSISLSQKNLISSALSTLVYIHPPPNSLHLLVPPPLVLSRPREPRLTMLRLFQRKPSSTNSRASRPKTHPPSPSNLSSSSSPSRIQSGPRPKTPVFRRCSSKISSAPERPIHSTFFRPKWTTWASSATPAEPPATPRAS